MNKEEYNKLSTFDKIEFDIDMQMYMEHSDKIASIYDHLGDVYSYKDLEDAKALEEHETFELYKKVLKEKCEAIDKTIEYIEIRQRKDKFLILDGEQIKELLNILQGDDKE